jgi:molybdopterin converting factor subunit 1
LWRNCQTSNWKTYRPVFVSLAKGANALKVHIKLFAGYRDKVGRPEVDLELPDDATVGYLAQEMIRHHPTLTRDAERLVVAVNQEFQDHSYVLSNGDEVALIPPVSGGFS